MFRFVILCGCLMAIAQAGIINGGILSGIPRERTLTIQPASNYLGYSAISTAPQLSLANGPTLLNGLSLSSGLGLRGLPLNGYGYNNGIRIL